MENLQIIRYPGDYDKFQEVYAMKKSQLEAAYNRQQKEIADLKDFVARNKANQTRKQNKSSSTAKNKEDKKKTSGDALKQSAKSSKEVAKDLDR